MDVTVTYTIDVCSVYSHLTTRAPNSNSEYRKVFLAPSLVHENVYYFALVSVSQ